MEGTLKIDKRELKGTCWTCRRGLFTFYQVWCMHPNHPEGYKAHHPFDVCPNYELSTEFKFFERILSLPRNKQFVEPHIKSDKDGKVTINGKNKTIYGTSEACSDAQSNPLYVDCKPDNQFRKRVEKAL